MEYFGLPNFSLVKPGFLDTKRFSTKSDQSKQTRNPYTFRRMITGRSLLAINKNEKFLFGHENNCVATTSCRREQ